MITGVFTLNSVDKLKYEPIPVYIDEDGAWFTGECLFDIKNFRDGTLKGLKKVALIFGNNTLFAVLPLGRLKGICHAACAINCTHGRNGEDGTVAAILNAANIPVASPNVFSSAMAMDKDVCKICLKGLGVPLVEGVTVLRREFFKNREDAAKRCEALGFPLIVKPCSSGSSIGIKVAKSREELISALVCAFDYDIKALVEKFVEGAKDVNCACCYVGGKTLVSECEVPTGGEILSFSDKYGGAKTGVKREFPADLPEKVTQKIKNLTKTIYEAFGFAGIIRIDYLVKGAKVFLNEINSVPGSLAYYLFCDTVAEFSALLDGVIDDGIDKGREYFSSKFAYKSDVLKLNGVRLKK